MLYLLLDLTYTIVKTTVNGIVYLVSPNTEAKDKERKENLIVNLVEENNTLVQENMRLKEKLESKE